MAKKKIVETKPKTFKPMPEAEPEAQDIKREWVTLMNTLSHLKGMNMEKARRIIDEGVTGNDVEVAARFGLDVMTAAEVIKVMEVSK